MEAGEAVPACQSRCQHLFSTGLAIKIRRKSVPGPDRDLLFALWWCKLKISGGFCLRAEFAMGLIKTVYFSKYSVNRPSKKFICSLLMMKYAGENCTNRVLPDAFLHEESRFLVGPTE